MAIFTAKDFRDDLRKRGAFFTPPELALFLRAQLPDDVSMVYDPTCGAGSLLSVFDDDVRKVGQELDADAIDYARKNVKTFQGAQGNTLTAPAFRDYKFDAIIANPPFSTKWDWIDGDFDASKDPRFASAPALPPKSKADYAFILHCLHYLADNGTAVILCFPGVLYRGNAEGKIRQWLVERGNIKKVIAVEGGKFEDTQISTVVLVITKTKNENITFVSDGKERVVDFAEIKENNFCLSPSSYIFEEIKKENIDPLELETKSRLDFVELVKLQLTFSKAVCEMEGWDTFPEFLDDIQNVLDSFRENQTKGIE